VSIFLPEEFQMRKCKYKRQRIGTAIDSRGASSIRKFGLNTVAASPPKLSASEWASLFPIGPRPVGQRLFIELREDRWELSVYSADVPRPPFKYLMTDYIGRRYGSLGIALDAFVLGKSIKSVLPLMKRAERAYAESSESPVTS
jgi:hypothetical protein